MNNILFNISVSGLAWGMTLAGGIIFTIELIKHLKEFNKTGEIVIKETRKKIFYYRYPKIIMIIETFGMILGYGGTILIIAFCIKG